MFNFLKSAETCRIEFLLGYYKELLNREIPEEDVRLAVIGELVMTAGPIKTQFKTLDIEAKKQELDKLFSPLRIREYEIFELVNFIVCWEFPSKYNYTPTVEQIRLDTHARVYLEKKIRKIGSQILK